MVRMETFSLCIMSVKLFVILLQCLRFDAPNTREKQLKETLVELISEIFEKFITNSQSAYRMGTSACVHEIGTSACVHEIGTSACPLVLEEGVNSKDVYVK
ncbi:hypothetical protein NPIL_520841 [Nephila pilipes]|uniref:PiggyBac transposable element-derived protein domain-containing protein n=1 Tax=Nephila pilipes TaxID=299642 RepID=A0A8X6QUV9_NEPPI|nr:hypothetical protein NPIL_520841 [Nephila pilipes]